MKNQGLLSVVFVIGGILIIWFGILPVANSVLKMRKVLADQQKEIKQAQVLRHDITNAYAGYSDALSKANAYLQAVPTRASQANLLVEIQSMASLSGVSVGSVDVDIASANQSKGDALRKIPVKISLSGGYAAIKQFLNLLEHNLPLFSADTMTITPQSVKEGTLPMYQLLVSYHTFAIN